MSSHELFSMAHKTNARSQPQSMNFGDMRPQLNMRNAQEQAFKDMPINLHLCVKNDANICPFYGKKTCSKAISLSKGHRQMNTWVQTKNMSRARDRVGNSMRTFSTSANNEQDQIAHASTAQVVQTFMNPQSQGIYSVQFPNIRPQLQHNSLKSDMSLSRSQFGTNSRVPQIPQIQQQYQANSAQKSIIKAVASPSIPIIFKPNLMHSVKKPPLNTNLASTMSVSHLERLLMPNKVMSESVPTFDHQGSGILNSFGANSPAVPNKDLAILNNPYDKSALRKKFEGLKFPSAEQIPYSVAVLTSPERNKNFDNTPKIIKQFNLKLQMYWFVIQA